MLIYEMHIVRICGRVQRVGWGAANCKYRITICRMQIQQQTNIPQLKCIDDPHVDDGVFDAKTATYSHVSQVSEVNEFIQNLTGFVCCIVLLIYSIRTITIKLNGLGVWNMMALSLMRYNDGEFRIGMFDVKICSADHVKCIVQFLWLVLYFYSCSSNIMSRNPQIV